MAGRRKVERRAPIEKKLRDGVRREYFAATKGRSPFSSWAASRRGIALDHLARLWHRFARADRIEKFFIHSSFAGANSCSSLEQFPAEVVHIE